MKIEEQDKQEIQGCNHQVIRRDEFKELFNEMKKQREENKKYKEVIDKAIEYIEKCLKQTPIENRTKNDDILDFEYEYILGILKEVE